MVTVGRENHLTNTSEFRINDSTQEENDCRLLLCLKFLAFFDSGKCASKSHYLNVAHCFMELLHALCFVCVRHLKNGKDGDTQHFWKAWKVLKSAFTDFLYMSYFYNVALWGVQSINNTALCISSHFKCQDQSSASQGLHWAADCIIKMLSGKQGPVFPSTP